MTSKAADPSNILPPQDQTRRVPRQPDGQGFYQVFAGGVRAAETRDGIWYIEPVFDAGHACAKGVLSTKAVSELSHKIGLKFIAFHRMGWINGDYHSSWSAFVPGQTNHMLGPADLWGNVASNLARARTAAALATLSQPNHEQIAAILDDHTAEERLARSISLSLRNMDLAMEQIAEFYFEKLVSHMESAALDGRRIASTLDQNLFAHVHSFFMHLGAARDYLAAFCAYRIGKDPQKVDSFARLIEAIRPEHLEADDVLKTMQDKGFFRPKATSSIKFEAAGWIEEVTDLRNEFMHRRAYGDRYAEQMGFVRPIDAGAGLYRYIRPVEVNNDTYDIQDVVLRHYREMTGICYAAAEASGRNLSVITLTDRDVVSATFNRG